MGGIAYIINGQPRTTWPAVTEVLDDEGIPTGATTDNLPDLIAALPPGTQYELLEEAEAEAWWQAHQPPEEKAAQIRSRRDALITQTDYLMMPDYPLAPGKRAALEAYRQALRDIPEQPGFPQAVVWPELDGQA